MTVADLARLLAGSRDPDGLLDARGVGARVGIGPAEELEIATTHIHHGAPIGSPVQLPDILSVISVIRGEPDSLVVRRPSDPDVARAALIQHPGNFASARGSDQLRWERSREHLLESEG